MDIRHIADRFGVSPPTAFRYCAHTAMLIFEGLKRKPDLLRWDIDEERADYHGVVPGFPKAISFVDGVKLGRRRPEDEVE